LLAAIMLRATPRFPVGFLGARINYVRTLCASDDCYVWLNHYRNPQNWKAHYRKTAGKYVYDLVASSGNLDVIDDFFHELRRYG
jgi:cysteine synthase